MISSSHRQPFVSARSGKAFTLVELLVVVAIIALLASLLLSAIGKAKLKAQGIQCMGNHRQLTLAWRLYAEDNQELLPTADPVLGKGVPWVRGIMNFDPANNSNWDVQRDLARSPLWEYCGRSARVWKCPADKSMVFRADNYLYKGIKFPRVRSMAMNFFLGGEQGQYDDGVGTPGEFGGWRVFKKLTDLTDPGPARTFVLLDGREDRLNTGSFAVSMLGYPNIPGLTRFSQDFPGAYHLRAGGLSFADGHSEIKRWLDPRTVPPLAKDDWVIQSVTTPFNPDIIWLQERATRIHKTYQELYPGAW